MAQSLQRPRDVPAFQMLAIAVPRPQVVGGLHRLGLAGTAMEDASRDVPFLVAHDPDQTESIESSHALFGDPITELTVGRVEWSPLRHRNTRVVLNLRDGVSRESRRSEIVREEFFGGCALRLPVELAFDVNIRKPGRNRKPQGRCFSSGRHIGVKFQCWKGE